ncbi:hypothetical protein Pcinc_041563, partial [Petrolisthes cinctipes]
CRGGSVEVRGGGAGDPSLKLCGEDERLHPPAVLYSDSGTATITYHSLSIPPTNPPVPSPSHSLTTSSLSIPPTNPPVPSPSYRPANALSPPSDPLVPSTSQYTLRPLCSLINNAACTHLLLHPSGHTQDFVWVSRGYFYNLYFNGDLQILF